eukprot:2208390-Pyramimonas_sp.AAC.1
MRTAALGPSVDLLLGPRDAVLGGQKYEVKCFGAHADGPTGGFRGASLGATKRCHEYAGRMRAAALGPSAGLRRGPRD